MEGLVNFANFLWVLTKITFLMLVLLAIFSEIIMVLISAIFGRNRREVQEEEREE